MSNDLTMIGTINLRPGIDLADLDRAVAAAFNIAVPAGGDPGAVTGRVLADLFGPDTAVGGGEIVFEVAGGWDERQDQFMAVLAPFVRDWETVEYEFNGEAGSRWRFTAGVAHDERALIVWPHPDGTPAHAVLADLRAARDSGEGLSRLRAAAGRVAALPTTTTI